MPSQLPDIAKLGQDTIWQTAIRRARHVGKDRDYNYVMQLYKEMTGWKSLDDSDMNKSYLNPYEKPARVREPGQVPNREIDREAMRMVQTPARPMTVARMLAHDGPRLTIGSILDDLGLDEAKRNDWMMFLENTVKGAVNEISLRQDIMSKALVDGMDVVLRNAILQRSMAFWKGYKKSMVQVMSPDELLRKSSIEKSEIETARGNPSVFTISKDIESLEKALGHKYTSRKKGKDGKWVYEYPEDKKKRIVDMILDWLTKPTNRLTVGQTSKYFRVDKTAAIKILKELESKGKIRKDGDKYAGGGKVETPQKAESKPDLKLHSRSTRHEITSAARELGATAFKNGLPPVPAQNKDLMDALKQLNPSGVPGNPNTMIAIKEYLNGWHQANLAAPVPGEEPKKRKSVDSALWKMESVGGGPKRAVLTEYGNMRAAKVATGMEESAITALEDFIARGGMRTSIAIEELKGSTARQTAFGLENNEGLHHLRVNGYIELAPFKEGKGRAYIITQKGKDAWKKTADEQDALLSRVKSELESLKPGVAKPKPKFTIPAEKARMVPGEQLSLFEVPVKPEPMILPMSGEQDKKEDRQTRFETTTVSEEKSENQITEEQDAENRAAGILGGRKLDLLKERGLMVVKKTKEVRDDAEHEAIGILSSDKFNRLTDEGLTVDWAPGAIPKASPPKDDKKKEEKPKPRTKPSKKESDAKSNKDAKDIQNRLEQTGDHIWGSRKDLARLGEITDSKQLEGMSYDDAAAIVKKSKLVPVHDLSTLRSMGMTPGTAHMTIALLASIKKKPGDSKAERAAYVDHIREVLGGIGEVKTVDQFKSMLSEFDDKRIYAQKWEVVETVDKREDTYSRIVQLTKDNPGVDYRSRYSYDTYTTDIVKKKARPYDVLGSRFTQFIAQKGKFHDGATREAYTVDNLWSYNKNEDVVDGWAYLEASDKKKKDEKKKKATKDKTNTGETKRGWSGAKDVAGEIRRVGGNVNIDSASAERTKKVFNLREVDYGESNYMTQADREYHTKALEESMYDFSEVLGVSPDTLSFKGRLGVALGARGRGKAKAHYEPNKFAINITKFRGGGSLAHEWGHALDNIVAGHYIKTDKGSSTGDAFLSVTPEHSSLPKELSGAISGVVAAMTKHPDPEKAIVEHREHLKTLNDKADSLISENNRLVAEHKALNNKPKSREIANLRIENYQDRIAKYEKYLKEERPQLEAMKERSRKKGGMPSMAVAKKKGEIKSREYWIKNNQEYISDMKKPDAVLSESDKKRMEEIKGEIEDLRTPINRANSALRTYNKLDPTTSEFYKSGQALGSNYWGTHEEMFARAFETYIQDELASKKRANTYLVAGTDMIYDTRKNISATKTAQPYPQGEERKRINAAMKKLMATIKETKSLEKSLQRMYIRL